MKYLFICAIGPVQEFIATARRSRDLWYGSWMLSELSKAAALSIVELSPPGELIFPNPEKPIEQLEPNSELTSPNKIVAALDDQPSKVAKAIRSAINQRLDHLWNDKRRINGPYGEQIAKQQVDDLIEFAWVSIPYDESVDEKYAIARAQAESMFAARKATRNFIQPTWSSNAPKSSLDGARESVIPASEYPERHVPPEDAKRKIENLYKNYHARRGEQLSGVDLLKRLGSPGQSRKFKSTSDMAAIPFIQWLDSQGEKGQALLENLRSLLPPETDELERNNEGLVFESRLKDSFPQQELSTTVKDAFRKAMKGLPTPNPYYALLAADGDFMGRLIDEHAGKESHKQISASMAIFASKALDIVEKRQGVPIYSGGDDVLAYLPLSSVLACAAELESFFREIMGEHATEKTKPSLSIGIAIVHHLEPLSDALQLVRQAEKKAKEVDGKNGLAVTLSKRSGENRTIVAKFEDLYPRLSELIQFSTEKSFSSGAAYELLELHRTLIKTNIPPEGRALEAVRIIERKRESSGAKMSDDLKGKFKGWIKTIELHELAHEMVIAKNLATREEAK